MGKHAGDTGQAPADDEPLTYAKAGVDIREEARSVGALVKALGQGREGDIQPLALPGHFAGGVRFGDHALILCTDGVGSKVEIARALGKFDTVGIDCMAMNVNDAICIGAEPIAFVDYLAVERHEEGFMDQVGRGLAMAAKEANVAIVGGETATLPGIVHGFDLAGTCLAVAHVDRLITGERVATGDVLIGLPSSGIHSNGLTLARKAVERAGLAYTDTTDELDGRTIGEELLTPTRIYVRPVLRALLEVDVKGLVHVTGGGVLNLPRLKKDVQYVLDGMPDQPAVFRMIERLGKVPREDLFMTFNMGVGFVLVVPAEAEQAALDALADEGAFRLGHVAEGRGVVIPGEGLTFTGSKVER